MAANRENGSEKTRDRSGHNYINRSPLHSHLHQTRAASKAGSASPAFEKRLSTEGMTTSAPGTPVRSRARTGSTVSRTAEQSEKSSLPKFGAWDVNDPSSGDGFTVIFNKARDEKKSSGSVRNSGWQPDSASKQMDESFNRSAISRKSSSKWCCCF